jgi:hypothetical protein
MRIVLSAVLVFTVLSSAVVFAQGEPGAVKQVAPAETVQPASQVQPQIPTSEPKEEPKAEAEPQQPKIAEKAAVPKEKEAVQKPALVIPAKNQAAPIAQNLNGLTLIEITDGNYRYARIQGMTFTKKDVAIAKSDTDAKKIIDNGLGKSGWKASIMVWISVVGIIILIIMLYRYGRKKRRGRVFRRFP